MSKLLKYTKYVGPMLLAAGLALVLMGCTAISTGIDVGHRVLCDNEAAVRAEAEREIQDALVNETDELLKAARIAAASLTLVTLDKCTDL